MAQVTLSHISKTYPNGFVAVQPASFDIPDGEFVVLVGPSGCGKIINAADDCRARGYLWR